MTLANAMQKYYIDTMNEYSELQAQFTLPTKMSIS